MSQTDRFIGFDSSGNRVPLAAFVENPCRDRVRIIAAPGYSLALFQLPGKPLEIAVVGDDDTWRLRIREQSEVETMTITHPEPNVIEIVYGDLFDGN